MLKAVMKRARRPSATTNGDAVENGDVPSYAYTAVDPSGPPKSMFSPVSGTRRPRQQQTSVRALGRAVRLAGTVGVCSMGLFVLIWWKLFGADVEHAVPDGEGLVIDAGETFTVRMNTWRRNDLLKKSAEHYATCPFVNQVQVVWSDQENEPPPMDLFREEARSKIAFEVHDTNSLNHRFNVTSPLDTTAVFSTDDDLKISCTDLMFAFEAWKSSHYSMVGFSPRVVMRDSATGQNRYRSWRYVRWNGVYNVILTKCCFLHRDHLKTYAEKGPPNALSYIDEHRNCEDILMSMIVAKYFGTPPLWVQGKFKEIGGTGISSDINHFVVRGRCVDFFAEQLGGMSLIATSVKAQPIHTGLLSWL